MALTTFLVCACQPELPAVGEVEGRCGDGVVGAGEACDDGNEVNEDACTNRCEAARCGDGNCTPAVPSPIQVDLR